MTMIYFHIMMIYMISTSQTQSHVTLHRKLDAQMEISKYVGIHLEQRAETVSRIERSLNKLLSSKQSPLDKADYVATPLTAMAMLRRLVQDWAPLAAVVGKSTKLHNLDLGKVRWPTITDYEQAAKAVMRSQKTYDLSTALLVRGVQSDIFLTNVSVADCLEIARQYFDKELFLEAKEWLQYALTGIYKSNDALLRETVLYYIAAALCFSDDTKSSKMILRDVLETNSKSKPPKELTNYYLIMATQGCLYSEGKILSHLDKIHELSGNDPSVYEYYRDITLTDNHNRLCRGEGKTDSRLRCHYVHYQKPHLRFQPFKLEELQLDPPVVRFQNLISDNETQSLIEEAKDSMRPSTVGVQKRLSEYRTSYLAWLVRNSSDWLDRRIADAMQLNTLYSEAHQVSRYSVSGEYLPHHDYFADLDWNHERFATVMFYLNDVENGGNTVFTTWNLSVPPVKNSAILWFNYKPNGEGDLTTEHSGCPVLKGTKWVLNKWVHQKGNSVNFPCTIAKSGSFKGFYL